MAMYWFTYITYILRHDQYIWHMSMQETGSYEMSITSNYSINLKTVEFN